MNPSPSFRAPALVLAFVTASWVLACGDSVRNVGESCSAEEVCGQNQTCSPVSNLCVVAGLETAPCSSPSDCLQGTCKKGACAEPTAIGNECESSSECTFADQPNGPVCARLAGSARGVCALQCDAERELVLEPGSRTCKGDTACCKLGDLPVTACVTAAFCR